MATIAVQYTDFTPAARAAFQYAVDIWRRQLATSVPIRVSAELKVLSGATLGAAGAAAVFRDFPGANVPATWYPKALANRLTGSDLDATTVDIVASFNSNVKWYYGTDGLTPAGQYDFVSVVLHELAHGLGFAGSMSVSNGAGVWGGDTGYPGIYDRFVETGTGQSLLDTALFPNGSSALAAELTSGELYWNGANGVTANGEVRPHIYVPGGWQQDSSYTHLDENAYPAGHPESLMTDVMGAAEAIHDPGAIVRGVLADEGWARRRLEPDAQAVGDMPCSSVSLQASVSFPVLTGTPVTWTAQATGCSPATAPEYQFWLLTSSTGTWSELRTWSRTRTASWTPTQPGTYVVQAWARQAGSTAAFEAWAGSGLVTITSPTGGAPCATVSLQASASLPVPAGTPVTWTAQAAGCNTPEYQFWLLTVSTGTWSVLRGWSPTSTASWTPTQAGAYAVQVWARRTGSTQTWETWTGSGRFDVVSTTGGLLCASVSLAEAHASSLRSNEVYADRTFRIAADHDGANTTSYRLYQNGGIFLTLPVSAQANGVITFDHPGLAIGTYVVEFSAVGPAGETRSAPLSVTAVPPGILRAGVPTVWTAQAAGCTTPEYQFWLFNSSSGTWSVLQPWSGANATSWTPTQSGNYVLQVWARQAGSAATWEAWAGSGYFTVSP